MRTLKTMAVLATFLAPASMLYAQQPNPTYIQVDGNKATAIKILKESGIRAKDTVKQKFALPDIKVTGNEKPVDLGELVVLKAELEQDTISEGLVNTTFKWTVLDNDKQKNLFVGDDGKTIAFAAGMQSKNIMVLLEPTCVFETKQKFTVVDKDGKNPTEKEFITEVSVKTPDMMFFPVAVGSTPTPDPGPNPDTPVTPVTPAPTFPDGQFGLAKFTYSAFAADTNLDQKSKVALASKLADGLEGIASQIGALATYRDVPTILADTKKANTTAFSSLSVDLSKSGPLKTVIGNKISELWKNQKINTATDIATEWQEMSQGLRAVK